MTGRTTQRAMAVAAHVLRRRDHALPPAASELTRGEAIADGIVHAAGLAIAVIGAGALVYRVAVESGPGETVAVLMYGLGLVAVFGCSAIYNFGGRLRRRDIWRRLDHAAIFAMIAGTYTPFTASAPGGWAIGLTVMVWAIAAVGMALKLTIGPGGSQALPSILYLAFGWIGFVAVEPFVAELSPTVVTLLVTGGALYTIGLLFFALKHMPYQRAIWHAFVLAGAAAHFCAIWVMTSPVA